MPHSQPTALQQTVCKIHLDPQYHIFHWGSTILGDSTLCGLIVVGAEPFIDVVMTKYDFQLCTVLTLALFVYMPERWINGGPLMDLHKNMECFT